MKQSLRTVLLGSWDALLGRVKELETDPSLKAEKMGRAFPYLRWSQGQKKYEKAAQEAAQRTEVVEILTTLKVLTLHLRVISKFHASRKIVPGHDVQGRALGPRGPESLARGSIFFWED